MKFGRRVNMDAEELLFVLDCFFIFVSVCLNSLILVVFLYSKKLRRIPSNNLLASFICTNLLVSFAGVLFVLSWNKYLLQSFKTLGERIAIFLIAGNFYTFNLLIITLDRYFAVVYPLRYSRKMNTRVSNQMVAIFWCLALAIIIMASICHNSYSNHIAHLALTSGTIATLSVLIGINLVIFRKVRYQVRLLSSLAVSCRGNYRATLKRHELKSAYLCFAMAATFACCSLPHCIAGFFHSTGKLDQIYMTMATSFYFLGMAINPFLYVLIKRDVRRCIWTLAMRMICSFRPILNRRGLDCLNFDPDPSSTLKKDCNHLPM